MKPWPHGALLVYLVALAFGVLTPHPPPVPLDPAAAARPPDGLVADAIRNLFLLMPLGWMLAALGRGPRFAAVIGLVLSIAIEVAQAVVPGRHPSLVDVVTNTASAAAGAWLYAIRLRWLAPEPGVAARFARVCAVSVAVGLVVGVQLLRLSPGGPDFYAGWRPELGQFEPYAGLVLDARIGRMALPVGRVADASALLQALSIGEPIDLTAELRPSRGGTAPLFTVHDSDQNEVLLVAAQRDDLLVEWRTWALALGLDQPDHRWAGALATGAPTNAAVEIRLERTASSAHLSIAGRPLGTRCWTPGRVWGLLIPGRIVPAPLEGLLDAVTIALLVLPCVYYARRLLPVALGFALLLVALSQVGPVALPRAPEWLGLTLGIALARLARVVCPRIVVLTPQSRRPDAFDEELR